MLSIDVHDPCSDWTIIKKSYEFSVTRKGKKLRGKINRDQHFDEFGYMKEFCI